MSDKELIEKIEDAYRRVRKIGPDAIYETELREVLRAAADALEAATPERDAAVAAIERVRALHPKHEVLICGAMAEVPHRHDSEREPYPIRPVTCTKLQGHEGSHRDASCCWNFEEFDNVAAYKSAEWADRSICSHCQTAWPCLTVAALAAFTAPPEGDARERLRNVVARGAFEDFADYPLDGENALVERVTDAIFATLPILSRTTSPDAATEAKWVCGKCSREQARGYDDGQIPEHHRTCPKRTEAKQPEGWSTEDRQEAKREAERRWSRPAMRYAEQRYQAGNINGFMLGAEWQKARETFISFRSIADEARAERDAALAAIERVRVAIRQYPNYGARFAVEAALDGAPESETPELFPGTNAALDRLTVRKAAPAEAFCIEHGNFHAVELGDPTCEFEDGFGEPVDGEKP